MTDAEKTLIEEAAAGHIKGTLIEWPSLASAFENNGVNLTADAPANACREIAKLILALNEAVLLNTEETAAVKKLSERLDLSPNAVVRQALRHYQLHQSRLDAGETVTYSGDAQRAAEFLWEKEGGVT